MKLNLIVYSIIGCIALALLMWLPVASSSVSTAVAVLFLLNILK